MWITVSFFLKLTKKTYVGRKSACSHVLALNGYHSAEASTTHAGQIMCCSETDHHLSLFFHAELLSLTVSKQPVIIVREHRAQTEPQLCDSQNEAWVR